MKNLHGNHYIIMFFIMVLSEFSGGCPILNLQGCKRFYNKSKVSL